VTNGGFETGDFSGWTATNPNAEPFLSEPWMVVDASYSNINTIPPTPREGTYDAINGFVDAPAGGAGHYTLSQTISIPAATTATLTWQDRLVYFVGGGSPAQPRRLEVKVLDPGTDAVLATLYTHQTPVLTFVDTGWQSHSADLSAFSGQTVKLVFDETIPQRFFGTGHAEFDAISVSTPFAFTGFFAPIDNGDVLNVMTAGRAVPVKFSLDGDQGLDILAVGSPSSRQIDCDSGVTLDDVEETSSTGSSSLSYDAASDQYKYVWKTDSAWAGTCRQLTVTLSDGTTHTTKFKFT
jgi:hypothetical protein